MKRICYIFISTLIFTQNKSFNKTEKFWDWKFGKGTIYSEAPSEIVKHISDYIKKAKTILDIGGGYGRNAAYFAKKGATVTVTDISEKALKIGKKNYGAMHNISFIKKDLLNLDFEKESFDAITGIYILNLFSKEELIQILGQLKNTLAAGGKLCSNFLSIEDDEFGIGKKIAKNTFINRERQIIRFYDETEIKNIFEAVGLIVDKISKIEEPRDSDTIEKNIVSRSLVVFARKN